MKTSPKNRALNAIIVFCIGCGGVFGMLALVATTSLYRMTGLFGLTIAGILGCMTGFVCALPAMPLLLYRDLRVAKPIIAWLTGLVIWIWFSVSQGNAAAFIGAPLVFLAFVLLARVMLPRVNLNPGHCSRCGYDLRESFQFGRCPECGSSINKSSLVSNRPAGQARKRLPDYIQRIGQFVFRHPMLVMLILMSGRLGSLHVLDLRRSHRDDAMVNAMKVAAINEVIDMDQLTSFEWDRVFIYGPYANPTVPPGVDVSSWNSMIRNLAPYVEESKVLVVFVRETRVAEHFLLPRSVDFSNNLYNTPLDRKRARFRVVQETDSSPYLLVLQPQPRVLGHAMKRPYISSRR